MVVIKGRLWSLKIKVCGSMHPMFRTLISFNCQTLFFLQFMYICLISLISKKTHQIKIIDCRLQDFIHLFYFVKDDQIRWRVSIRKTFAQFLRNETQNFSFVAHQFCAKKQQFAQTFAKVISRKIALFRFFATRVLRNSAISL